MIRTQTSAWGREGMFSHLEILARRGSRTRGSIGSSPEQPTPAPAVPIVVNPLSPHHALSATRDRMLPLMGTIETV